MDSPLDPRRRDPRDVVMQRVRIGVTGLAAVFLLTLLAASILSLFGQDAHTPPSHAAASAKAAADALPKEPLAELGVAPGNNPKTPPPPAPSPSTAQAPAPTP